MWNESQRRTTLNAGFRPKGGECFRPETVEAFFADSHLRHHKHLPTPTPAESTVDELLPEVYDQLRAMARGLFRRESSENTLQPTAVVNEVYLKLIGQTRVHWQSPGEMLGVASMMMRRILVDHARKKLSVKRGGQLDRNDSALIGGINCEDHAHLILDLHQLLLELEGLNERHARVIELRYFSGMTIRETADVLGVSEFTVKNDWRIARAWLLLRLRDH